jgi:hypothetical protein
MKVKQMSAVQKERIKKKKQLLVTSENPKINSYFAPVPNINQHTISHQGI